IARRNADLLVSYHASRRASIPSIGSASIPASTTASIPASITASRLAALIAGCVGGGKVGWIVTGICGLLEAALLLHSVHQACHQATLPTAFSTWV
ncbi:hypothetical protein, partial [Amycolatopsis dongchuanensis]|uniref:hypothetical protein n=1 Tax=Amycolatopsis dongchuanensis TaxID=1070866 RepID=UPI0031F97589